MLWTDTRLCALLDIEHPIIQAPMGSLGCAMFDADRIVEQARAESTAQVVRRLVSETRAVLRST